jgi:hypothetical protein
MAQNVAEQIGAHSGPTTTTSIATIATIAAAQRFFPGNFGPALITLLRYAEGLDPSTAAAILFPLIPGCERSPLRSSCSPRLGACWF